MTDLFSSLENLPDHPANGAIELIRRLKKMAQNEDQYCDACAVLSAYYEANNLKIPSPIPLKRSIAQSNLQKLTTGISLELLDTVEAVKSIWSRQFTAYEQHAASLRFDGMKAKAQERLNSIKPPEFGYAVLDDDEKRRCREYLERIKNIVENSEISERKKNAIFTQINNLMMEIDRVGTKTGAFFVLFSEFGFHAGEFGKNAKPLFEEIRKLIEAVSTNRARREGTELPKPEDMFRLPPPNDEEK